MREKKDSLFQRIKQKEQKLFTEGRTRAEEIQKIKKTAQAAAKNGVVQKAP